MQRMGQDDGEELEKKESAERKRPRTRVEHPTRPRSLLHPRRTRQVFKACSRPSFFPSFVFLSSYPRSSHRLRCTKTARARCGYGQDPPWDEGARMRGRCQIRRDPSLTPARRGRWREGEPEVTGAEHANCAPTPSLLKARRASTCIERFATPSPSSSSTPMTGRDSKRAILALLRGSRSPAPYSVRLALHEQRGARAYAPALALLLSLPPLFLLTAGGGHIGSFHPTSHSTRPFTPTQLLVSRRTSLSLLETSNAITFAPSLRERSWQDERKSGPDEPNARAAPRWSDEVNGSFVLLHVSSRVFLRLRLLSLLQTWR
jgi:hypothetical protein